MARHFITLVYLLALGAMAATPAQAQERTAGSALDLQMTWSSLKSQIDSVRNSLSIISSKVDVITTCGKLGMVYAPGVTGAVNGCLNASVSNTLLTEIHTNTTNVTNILNCTDNGQTYNKTTGKCTDTNTTVTRLGSPVTFTMSTGSSKSGVSANYAIPAGTTVIAANVMCKVIGSKATIDSSINFNNPGGYPANKFCYLQGVSKDNTAMIMDTKYIPVPTGSTVFSISYNATQVQNTTDLTGTMTFLGRK